MALEAVRVGKKYAANFASIGTVVSSDKTDPQTQSGVNNDDDRIEKLRRLRYNCDQARLSKDRTAREAKKKSASSSSSSSSSSTETTDASFASPVPPSRHAPASEDASGGDNAENLSPSQREDVPQEPSIGEEDSEDEGPGDFDEDVPPDYLPRFWWAFLLFCALSNTNKSKRLSLFDPTPAKDKSISRKNLKKLQSKGKETARTNGDTGNLPGARGVSASEQETKAKRARIVATEKKHMEMRRLEDDLLALQGQNQGIKTQFDICKTQLESEFFSREEKVEAAKEMMAHKAKISQNNETMNVIRGKLADLRKESDDAAYLFTLNLLKNK